MLPSCAFGGVAGARRPIFHVSVRRTLRGMPQRSNKTITTMTSIRPRPPPIYILNLRDLLALSYSAVTTKPFQHSLVVSSARYHTQGRNTAGGEFVYGRRGFYSDSGNEQMGNGQGHKRSAISQARRIAPALRRAAFGFHYEITLTTLERRITVSTMVGTYLRSTRRSPVDRRLRLVGRSGRLDIRPRASAK